MARTSNVKTDANEDLLLKAVFHGEYSTTIFGGTYTPSPISLYISLNTADPGVNTSSVGGVQSKWEIDDPAATTINYQRGSITQGAGNFSIAGNLAQNTPQIDNFTVGGTGLTGGSVTATHATVGHAATGNSAIWYRAELQSTLPISSGVNPTIPASTGMQVTED